MYSSSTKLLTSSKGNLQPHQGRLRLSATLPADTLLKRILVQLSTGSHSLHKETERHKKLETAILLGQDLSRVRVQAH